MARTESGSRAVRSSSDADLAMVVAVSENGVIGDGPRIPWRLPDDQKFFRRITLDHSIIMGRATWDTIGTPLPRRTSVVLSRNRSLSIPGAYVAYDFDEALSLARAHAPTRPEAGAGADGDTPDRVFVIGGAALYDMALSRAELAYVTRVHAEFEGDVRFDGFSGDGPPGWVRVETDRHPVDDRHAIAFTIETWRRAKD